jgi:hypothetical protein
MEFAPGITTSAGCNDLGSVEVLALLGPHKDSILDSALSSVTTEGA